MIELTKSELRFIEGVLRASADNITYLIEESVHVYVEDDVLISINEALDIIEANLQ